MLDICSKIEHSALESLRFKGEFGNRKKTQTKTKSNKNENTSAMQHGSRFGPIWPATRRQNTTRIRQYQLGSFFHGLEAERFKVENIDFSLVFVDGGGGPGGMTTPGVGARGGTHESSLISRRLRELQSGTCKDFHLMNPDTAFSLEGERPD